MRRSLPRPPRQRCNYQFCSQSHNRKCARSEFQRPFQCQCCHIYNHDASDAACSGGSITPTSCASKGRRGCQKGEPATSHIWEWCLCIRWHGSIVSLSLSLHSLHSPARLESANTHKAYLGVKSCSVSQYFVVY